MSYFTNNKRNKFHNEMDGILILMENKFIRIIELLNRARIIVRTLVGSFCSRYCNVE